MAFADEKSTSRFEKRRNDVGHCLMLGSQQREPMPVKTRSNDACSKTLRAS